ncbi:MAG: right-handed parallel beta-helix repeat-containing protein [Candidatus Thermoplasmatota archaeon]|nr:right-handed parallel beta-helix repeat-containing protein [Candidatus Thermoplasmatota archaeon]
MTRGRLAPLAVAMTFLLLVVPIITGDPILTSVSGLDTVTGNININGDTALASSPYVRSGSGTSNSPYILSDYDMGQYQLRIDNTVSVVVIRNITFGPSASMALYFSGSRNLLIENISCTGRGSFLYSSGCRDIALSKANVQNVQDGTNLVDVRNPSRFTIRNCNFTRSSTGTTPIILFNDQGSNKVIMDSRFDNVPVDLQGAGTTGKVENCTFIESRLTLRGGESGTLVADNRFTSASGNGLYIYATYRAWIEGNTFKVGGSGIYFYQMAYQTSSVNGVIENNTFESCNYGINTENNWNICRLSKYDIKNNYFGNCTNSAIDLNMGQDSRIWRNIFYHNKGTLDSGSAAQCEQTVWASNNNQWTVNGQGNYWANHRSPDNDNDGFVDVNYTIPNNGLDSRPYTNPYLDSERPYLALLEPLSSSPERSYTVVRWSASDSVSGISKVEFSLNSAPFKDVTSQTGTSLWLEKGNHKLRIRATDRAGLYTLLQRDITLKATYQDLYIESPLDGEYLRTSSVDLVWRAKSFLIPTNQSLEIDGMQTYEAPDLRFRTIQLSEGVHDVLLRVRDQYGLDMERYVNFTVDITQPFIDIISPGPGSTLSLEFITFAFIVTDNIALDRTDVSLDGGPWAPVQQPDRHKVSVQAGNHTLDFLASDKAGNVRSSSVPFRVGDPPDLLIVTPLNGTVTSDTTVPLEWTYTGPFEYTKTLLRIGRAGLFKPTLPSGKVIIPLDEEGALEVTVRLEDDLQNFVEKSVVIIRDITGPRVSFTQPMQGEYISNSVASLNWTAFDGSDNDGSLRFLISMDGGPFKDVGKSRTYDAVLGEGFHKATVRAVDLANNTGEDTLTFYVDRTPPIVEFKAPLNGSFIKDPQLDVRWDASDNMLLRNLTLYLDGAVYAEVADRSYLPLPVSHNGRHTLKLIAVDGAGLTAEASIIFFLDTQPPLLEWTGDPPGISRSKTLYLSWSVEEKVGLSKLKLVAGNMTITLPVGATNATVALEEGEYTIFYLSATDLADMETKLYSPVNVIIDMTPPLLSIDLARSQVKAFKADVYWLSSDNLSGQSSTQVTLDGIDTVNIPSGNLHTFSGISPGAHSITITVRDRAGNEADMTWNFTVSKQGGGEEEEDDRGMGLNTILIIAVICAVILTVIVFLILRSRRKKDAESARGQVRSGPTKLKLSIPAPVSNQGLPAHGPGTLPPAQAGPHKRTEETGDGSGYIRPTRPKKDKRKQKGPAGPDDEMDILDDRTPSVPLEQPPTGAAAPSIPPEMETNPFLVPDAKASWGTEAPERTPASRPGEDKGRMEGGPAASEVDEGEVETLDELEELDEVDEAGQEDIEEWTA